jgi:hypothetical protein
MPGSALPAGSRTAPKALYSGSRLSMQLKTASYSATSMTWPRPAVGVAVAQRQQHADHAVQRGQRVADAHAHAHRHAAGLARQVAQPAHGLGHHAEAGLVAVGAGLAVAADAQHDQARVGAAGPRTQAPGFQRAGRKFSISTSASAASRRTSAWPSGCAGPAPRALVARLHLPPHRGAVLQQPPLAQRVAASPGGSTLITSAPKSASVLPAKGPAISWPSSSTFSPAQRASQASMVLGSVPAGTSQQTRVDLMAAVCEMFSEATGAPYNDVMVVAADPRAPG